MTKSPGTPKSSFKGGAMTRESAKVRPIEAPTIAMAFVMTRSRTLSEIIAVTAAEMAPAPCRARPSMTRTI